MWVAPYQCGLENRRRKNILRMLRQQGEIFRDVLAPLGYEGFAVKKHFALVDAAQACKCQQGQRFAGTVLTEHSKKITAFDMHLQARDKRSAGNRDRQITACKS